LAARTVRALEFLEGKKVLRDGEVLGKWGGEGLEGELEVGFVGMTAMARIGAAIAAAPLEMGVLLQPRSLKLSGLDSDSEEMTLQLTEAPFTRASGSGVQTMKCSGFTCVTRHPIVNPF